MFHQKEDKANKILQTENAFEAKQVSDKIETTQDWE